MRDDTVEGDDKRAVEQVLMDQTDLPSTILRLPMVYGPGDQQHRMYNVLRQIQDNRQTILLEDSLAVAILPRGYVENVAAAIALAVTDERAVGRVYNIAETDPVTEEQWVRQIGGACEWQGSIHRLPMDRLPEHLQHGLRTEQSIETGLQPGPGKRCVRQHRVGRAAGFSG